MLQAILFRSRYRAVEFRRPLVKYTPASSVHKLQWHRTISSVNNQKLLIRTVTPSRLTSSQQEVLDLSQESKPALYCEDEPDKPVQLQYEPNEAFPPNTRGIFYYQHNTQGSHLRFRLCTTAEEFHTGVDLLRRDGHAWKLTMNHMTTWTSKYLPLLRVISNELPTTTALMNEMFAARRLIFTLSPQDLVAKRQPVLDISDCTLPTLKTRFDDGIAVQVYYQTCNVREIFPANTRGVFYYKQSTTSPTTIGELRFRLCDDPASFHAGTDLCLSSGLPWAVSSDSLFSFTRYTSICKQLRHEGLVLKPPTRYRNKSRPLISGLNQPFVVNLSISNVEIIVAGQVETQMIISPFSAPRNGSMKSPYNGRAVVQLERYPSEYVGAKAKTPLFAMRILELLTPLQDIPHDDPTMLQRPKAGELLHRRRKGGGYSPWGYNPSESTSRKVLELVMQTPSIHE